MIRIAVLGIITTILGLQMKQIRSEYAGMLSLAGCILIFTGICGSLSGIADNFTAILNDLNIRTEYLGVIIKMIGAAYLAEFSSSVCRDAGFSALASQIEIFAKLYMLSISMPIVMALLQTIETLWS